MSYGLPVIEQLSNGYQVASLSVPSDLGIPTNVTGDPATGVPNNTTNTTTAPDKAGVTALEGVAGNAIKANVSSALGINQAQLESTIRGWGLGIGLFLVALVLIAIGGKVLLEA